MTKKETLDLLEQKGLSFEITEHEAVFSMSEVCSVPLPYPDDDAKNLFVRDAKRRNYYLITLRGDKRVDLKEFKETYGLKTLSFASADELMDILGVAPGSVSPLGLLCDEEKKVVLCLDEEFRGGKIGVHPNDNTATVWLKTDELESLIRDHGNVVRYVVI